MGRPKAMVTLDGERLVDRAVRVLVEGGCHPVYVVVGATSVPDLDAVTVDNPQWRDGMGSSVRTGLGALGDEVDAAVLLLVDQPGIGAAAIARVVRALDEGHPLVVASYAGQQRHPVGIARELWADVAGLAAEDRGARAFIAAHPDLVTAVDCSEVADPVDVDTPAELAAFAAAVIPE